MKRDWTNLLKATLCALIIDACGGTLGGNPDSVVEVPALSLSLTDAPIDEVRSVFVTVESVAISRIGDDWITIPLKKEEEIDLLGLQDGKATALAAINDLPAGTYGQTRLILSAENPARLIDLDGTEHELKIPSGSESGLKIQTSFEKKDGIPLALTIDFDLRKSIKSAGNSGKYMLKPVLRLVDDTKVGRLSGQGVSGTLVCAYADASVSFDTDDEACDNAVNSARVKQGVLTMANLVAGAYDLLIFRSGTKVGTLQDVRVEAGQINSSIILP